PVAGGETAMGKPHWPPHCRERVGEERDYAGDPKGYQSLEKALLAEAPGAGYRLQRVPPAPHRRAAWWIVESDTGAIYAQASAFHGPGGWLVDEIERCA